MRRRLCTQPSRAWWSRTALVVLGTLAVTGAPRRADASDPAASMVVAEELFRDGMALYEKKAYASACPKLAESMRLDPSAMGTQFYLARCYEKVGRLASAWGLFLLVAGEARVRGNAHREWDARMRSRALEPRLTKVRIVVPPSLAKVPGLRITRDGLLVGPAIWGTPIAIDPGSCEIRVEAGEHRFRTRVDVRVPGRTVDVLIPPFDDDRAAAGAPAPAGSTDAEVDEGPAAEAAAAPGDRAAEGVSSPPTGALALGGVGLACIGVGAALGLSAGSRWSDAEQQCPAHTGCSLAARELGDEARWLAHGSTVGFAAGSAALAVALGLWITAPTPADRRGVGVSPLMGREGGGVQIEGRF